MEELIQRCSWATTDLYKEYHDNEWGKPVHDENKLFEMLILEGMQAGLSWLTILNKREAFRIAFDNFNCKKVALYDDAKIEELMQNSSIVRNRLKIKSAITKDSFATVIRNGIRWLLRFLSRRPYKGSK